MAANVNQVRQAGPRGASGADADTGALDAAVLTATGAAAAAAASAAASAALAPFTPESLPGVTVWFDVWSSTLYQERTAASTPSEIGDVVGTIIYASGKHWVAESDAARPVLMLDENGVPGLYFDGVNTSLTSIADFAMTGAAGEYSAFAMVSRDDNTSDFEAAMAVWSSGTPLLRTFIVGLNSTGAYVSGFTAGATQFSVQSSNLPAVQVQSPVAIGATCDGTGVISYRDGLATRRMVIPGVQIPASTKVRLGGKDGSTDLFKGFIYAAVLCTEEISEHDAKRLTAYWHENTKTVPASRGQLPWFCSNIANQAWAGWGSNAVRSAATEQTWISWEGYDWSADRFEYWVRVYDNAQRKWLGMHRVGYGNLHTDDHGAVALARDYQGYWHCFGGAHNSPMQHFVTKYPDDPTEWVELPVIEVGAGNMTYPHPHPIGEDLHLIMRDAIVVDDNSALGITSTTALEGGVATWGAMTYLVNFTSDNRIYLYRSEVKDGKIHLCFLKSPAADTYRRPLYHAIYDPADGSTSNLDGSYSQIGTINEATANAEYMLEPAGTDDYTSAQFAFDQLDDTLLHYLIKIDGNHVYRPYVNGVAGTDIIVAPATADSTAGGIISIIVAGERGDVGVYYVDTDEEFSAGGYIYRNVKPFGSSTFLAAELVGKPDMQQGASVWGFDNVAAVRNGSKDLQVIWNDSFPASYVGNTPQGYFRGFACNEKGEPVMDEHKGPSMALLDLTVAGEALAPGPFPAGRPIGRLDCMGPHSDRLSIRTNRQELITHRDQIEIIDGYVWSKKALTGSIRPLARSVDFEGFVSDNVFAINIRESESYTFVNSAAQSFVQRSNLRWSAASMAALDAHFVELDGDGVLELLDVYCPRKIFGVNGALQNAIQDAHHATMIHGFEPVIFNPHIRLEPPLSLPGVLTDTAPACGWTVKGVAYQHCLEIDFNPATAGGNFTQNSGAIGIFGSAPTVDAAYNVFGWSDGTDGTWIGFNNANKLSAAVNSATPAVSTAAIVTAGWLVANRTGASATVLYRDGVALSLASGGSATSTTPNSAKFKVGSTATNSFSPYKWEGLFIGASMDATKQAAFVASEATYAAAMRAAAP